MCVCGKSFSHIATGWRSKLTFQFRAQLVRLAVNTVQIQMLQNPESETTSVRKAATGVGRGAGGGGRFKNVKVIKGRAKEFF